MIKASLINPEILAELAKCGHGDRILIAGANFPMTTNANPDAKIVYLGVSGDVPTTSQVLRALAGMINVESADVLAPQDATSAEYSALKDYEEILPGTPVTHHERYPFYAMCGERGVRLAIQTGDLRQWGNIMVTMNVVRAE